MQGYLHNIIKTLAFILRKQAGKTPAFSLSLTRSFPIQLRFVTSYRMLFRLFQQTPIISLVFINLQACFTADYYALIAF